MVNLKNEGLLSVPHTITNDDDLETLSEYIDSEYGGGYVVGGTIVIYESCYGDQFSKDVLKWVEEINEE